jgi:hypothetical protein
MKRVTRKIICTIHHILLVWSDLGGSHIKVLVEKHQEKLEHIWDNTSETNLHNYEMEKPTEGNLLRTV